MTAPAFPVERVKAAYDLVDAGEAVLSDGRLFRWRQLEWVAPDPPAGAGATTVRGAAHLLEERPAGAAICGCVAGAAVVEELDGLVAERPWEYIHAVAVELLGLEGLPCVARELFGGRLERAGMLDLLGRAIVDGGWWAAHGPGRCSRPGCGVDGDGGGV